MLSEEPKKDKKNLQPVRPSRWRKGIGIFFKILFFSFLLLIISIYIFLNNASIQSWAAQKAATYLSNQWGTTVSINRLKIDIFQNIYLKDVYVEDFKGDTLLSSGNLSIQLSSGLFSLLNNELYLESLSLENARLFLRKDSAYHNINTFFRNISSPKAKEDTPKNINDSPRPKAFKLALKTIHLKNIQFQEDNPYFGKLITLRLKEGHLKVDSLKPSDKSFAFESIHFYKPKVLVKEYRGSIAVWPPPVLPDPIEDENAPVVVQKSYIPLSVTTDKLIFEDGFFKLDNYRKAPERLLPEDQLEYNHMEVKDIRIEARNFKVSDWNFAGKLNHMSFQEKSGVVLEKLSVEDGIVTTSGFELNGIKLKTADSYLGDTLKFDYNQYEDFFDFPNKVNMHAKFKEASLALKDLMTFAPPLRLNKFFAQNENESLQINGQIDGKVIRLDSDNLRLSIGKRTFAQGSIKVRDITSPDQKRINLSLDKLVSNIPTLKLLIPNFNPPAELKNLGRLEFEGRFDFLFQDILTQGTLKSNIGQAEMDIQIKAGKKGKDKDFSGKLNLVDFDIGALINNPDFGKVTLYSELHNGKGLNTKEVYADLIAQIHSLTFKEYTYKNAYIKGEIKRNLFDGNLDIADGNIDLSFIGKINFQDSIPTFNFRANVQKLALMALNLSRKNLVLSGNVDLNLKGKAPSDMIGRATVRDFLMINETDTLVLDSVVATATQYRDDLRMIDLHSDIAEGYLIGHYSPKDIPPALLNLAWDNFPNWSSKLGLEHPQTPVLPLDFVFNLRVHDTKNITDIFRTSIQPIRQLSLSGSFDNQEDSIKILLKLPSFKTGKLNLSDINLNASGYSGNLTIHQLSADSIYLDSSNQITRFASNGHLNKDTLGFELLAENLNSEDSIVHLEGNVAQIKDLFQFSFSPENLFLFNRQWSISENNYLQFGKDFFDARNFTLKHDQYQIYAQPIGQKGLGLSVLELDWNIINELTGFKPMQFDGNFDVLLEVENLYKLLDMSLIVESQALKVNEDDWGALRLDIDMENLKKPASVYLSFTGPENGRQFIAEGSYYPPFKWHKEKNKNLLNASVVLSLLPLEYAEYFISQLISETKGTLDAELDLNGKIDFLNIGGEVRINKFGTKINFLQTRYFVDQGVIKVNNQLFDATGLKITDVHGNPGYITGGITHNRLRDFGLELNLKADKMECLNTKKKDNKLFYGYGMGEVDVTFSGSFQQTQLLVNGTSLGGTKIVIPISGEEEASPVTFIRFVEKDQKIDTLANPESPIIKGMNLDMNLSINQNAEIELVFDEQAGDIIRGRGTGNIQFDINRSGEFNMYGNYQVETGEYLFTLYNLVNKPFKIKEGSSNTIRWTGDPYNAYIQIDAEYSGLNTPLYNFLIEYLENVSSDSDVKKAASNPTQVDLIMHLEGPLLKPEIRFDIDFPELTGELKNYADTKINILKQDPNELNRQVFGLIVIGAFLPSNGGAVPGNGYIAATGLNTLSELLSNQLSIYLTELLSEVFDGVSFISGVDFDIAYNVYSNNNLNNSADPDAITRGGGSEIQLSQKVFLDNDRISLNLGGNVSNTQQTASQGVLFAPDIAIEVVLTQDRRYRFKFYSRSETRFDQGLQTKTGAGLVYRREFDSFDELLGHLNNITKPFKRK